jgi:hypothetical protein
LFPELVSRFTQVCRLRQQEKMMRCPRTNDDSITKITKVTKFTEQRSLTIFVIFVNFLDRAWRRSRGNSSRTARVACMTVVTVLAAGVLASAQAGTDPSFERMKTKLKAGDRVTLDLQNGSTLEGRFIDVGSDALSISTAIGDRRLVPGEVVQVHRHRRGVLLGAIIGGGVGLACGAMVGSIFANEGYDRDGPLFGLTAIGLGAGIAIDALVNIPRTVYQRTPGRTAIKLDVGPHRTALGVVVAF